jgi:hypothetical protein
MLGKLRGGSPACQLLHGVELIGKDRHPVVRKGLFERQPPDARGVGLVGDGDVASSAFVSTP